MSTIMYRSDNLTTLSHMKKLEGNWYFCIVEEYSGLGRPGQVITYWPKGLYHKHIQNGNESMEFITVENKCHECSAKPPEKLITLVNLFKLDI